ncbi:MAG: hypothetical protein GF328_14025, partial [Candidatus Latescibacteria bacterium]|nr:hypothetical protein [Candidatus Latescibacterota bacterium]
MRSLPILLFLVAAATARGSPPPVFVELESPRKSYFVGEPAPITLRLGLDRGFLETNLVPLFGRELDVQVQIEAPGTEGLPGLELLPGSPDPEGAPRRSLVLNAEVTWARLAEDRVVAGRPFVVFELTRHLLPTRSGEVTIPGPVVRYAHATRFAEDFITGRRPLDRREELEKGDPLRLRLLELPREGRPPGFAGAVGEFAIEARAEPTVLERGEILRLTLEIEGKGNRARFPPPRLHDLPGFHLYGMIDDEKAPVRTVVYELAPVGEGVEAIPAIPFTFFDPGPPAAYRVVKTRPIPLAVRSGSAPPAARPPESEERT